MLSMKNIADNIGINEEIAVGTYIYRVATGKAIPVMIVWAASDDRTEMLADTGIIWSRIKRHIHNRIVLTGHGGVIHVNGREADYTEEVNYKTFMEACREIGIKAQGIKVIRTAKQLNAA